MVMPIKCKPASYLIRRAIVGICLKLRINLLNYQLLPTLTGTHTSSNIIITHVMVCNSRCEVPFFSQRWPFAHKTASQFFRRQKTLFPISLTCQQPPAWFLSIPSKLPLSKSHLCSLWFIIWRKALLWMYVMNVFFFNHKRSRASRTPQRQR